MLITRRNLNLAFSDNIKDNSHTIIDRWIKNVQFIFEQPTKKNLMDKVWHNYVFTYYRVAHEKPDPTLTNKLHNENMTNIFS